VLDLTLAMRRSALEQGQALFAEQPPGPTGAWDPGVGELPVERIGRHWRTGPRSRLSGRTYGDALELQQGWGIGTTGIGLFGVPGVHSRVQLATIANHVITVRLAEALDRAVGAASRLAVEGSLADGPTRLIGFGVGERWEAFRLRDEPSIVINHLQVLDSAVRRLERRGVPTTLANVARVYARALAQTMAHEVAHEREWTEGTDHARLAGHIEALATVRGVLATLRVNLRRLLTAGALNELADQHVATKRSAWDAERAGRFP